MKSQQRHFFLALSIGLAYTTLFGVLSLLESSFSYAAALRFALWASMFFIILRFFQRKSYAFEVGTDNTGNSASVYLVLLFSAAIATGIPLSFGSFFDAVSAESFLQAWLVLTLYIFKILFFTTASLLLLLYLTGHISFQKHYRQALFIILFVFVAACVVALIALSLTLGASRGGVDRLHIQWVALAIAYVLLFVVWLVGFHLKWLGMGTPINTGTRIFKFRNSRGMIIILLCFFLLFFYRGILIGDITAPLLTDIALFFANTFQGSLLKMATGTFLFLFFLLYLIASKSEQATYQRPALLVVISSLILSIFVSLHGGVDLLFENLIVVAPFFLFDTMRLLMQLIFTFAAFTICATIFLLVAYKLKGIRLSIKRLADSISLLLFLSVVFTILSTGTLDFSASAFLEPYLCAVTAIFSQTVSFFLLFHIIYINTDSTDCDLGRPHLH